MYLLELAPRVIVFLLGPGTKHTDSSCLRVYSDYDFISFRSMAAGILWLHDLEKRSITKQLTRVIRVQTSRISLLWVVILFLHLAWWEFSSKENFYFLKNDIHFVCVCLCYSMYMEDRGVDFFPSIMWGLAVSILTCWVISPASNKILMGVAVLALSG